MVTKLHFAHPTGTTAAIPAGADSAVGNKNVSTCRIPVRPFDYVVKAGQLPGPKIIRYRKRRNHAAVFGCDSAPDGYDGSLEGEVMERDIGALNEEMDAAGARIFAGGLSPASNAKSLRAQPDGKMMDHRRAVPGDQGARRRFLDPENRKPGGGAGVLVLHR